MRTDGDSDFLVHARRVLLDALAALEAHRASVVVIGAQAVYLHTGKVKLAIAELTKDADLAFDPRALAEVPRIEAAMQAAGFTQRQGSQPGAWTSGDDIQVDLMVPTAALADQRGRRGARMPPHSRHAVRRADGLEAAIVDHTTMRIPALDPADGRRIRVAVASPTALLVAKLHKIGERQGDPERLLDKDAHDIYRLLVTGLTNQFAAAFRRLQADVMAGPATTTALDYLRHLFVTDGAGSLGAVMAGRAEQDVGDPDNVSASVSHLAAEILGAVTRPTDIV